MSLYITLKLKKSYETMKCFIVNITLKSIYTYALFFFFNFIQFGWLKMTK